MPGITSEQLCAPGERPFAESLGDSRDRSLGVEEYCFDPNEDALVWEFPKLTVSDAKQQLILALPLDGGIFCASRSMGNGL